MQVTIKLKSDENAPKIVLMKKQNSIIFNLKIIPFEQKFLIKSLYRFLFESV